MTEVQDLPQVEVITTMGELNEAAAGLQRAANRLYNEMKRFEGPDGTGTRYAIAVSSKLLEIYDQAVEAEKRPPAEDIRTAMAEKSVREEQPDLYKQWREAATEIEATRIWISAVKQSISARQSVLRGERG